MALAVLTLSGTAMAKGRRGKPPPDLHSVIANINRYDVDGDDAICPYDLDLLRKKQRRKVSGLFLGNDLDEDGCLSAEDVYYLDNEPTVVNNDTQQELELNEITQLAEGVDLYNSTQDRVIPVLYCGPDYATADECARLGQVVIAEWIRRVNQWSRATLVDPANPSDAMIMLRISKRWGVFLSPTYERWAGSARKMFQRDPSVSGRLTAEGRNVVMIFKVIRDISAIDETNQGAAFQEGGGGNTMNCAVRYDEFGERFLYRYIGGALARLDTACLHGLGHSLYHGSDPAPLLALPHPNAGSSPCSETNATEDQCRTLLSNEPWNTARGRQSLMDLGWASTDLLETNNFGDYLDIIRYELDRLLFSPLWY